MYQEIAGKFGLSQRPEKIIKRSRGKKDKGDLGHD